MSTPPRRSADVDPATAVAVEDLAALLERLRLRAGNPSLREIEAMGKRRKTALPRATVAEIFTGRRFPRRSVLLSLIAVLDVPGEEHPKWAAAWERIAERSLSSKRSVDNDDAGPGSPATTRVIVRPLDQRPGEASVWRFATAEPITLICSQLPDDLRRNSFSNPDDPDYIELASYSDPDALLHLYGHVRALNPHLEVRFSTTTALRPDDYMTHLVILGGSDFNILTRELMPMLRLPVQMPPEGVDRTAGLGLEVTGVEGVRRFRPVLETTGDTRTLREDVVLFFRGPNPFNADCTITICAGMFARGTLAAVRCLTDPSLGHRNDAYLRSRFAGRTSFGFVARAHVANGVVMPPDLGIPENRLYEWTSPA